ncbi:GAF and ANTAR domain-containing protein [Streptomyces sp. NPDC058470]|uniref:GAF and ANTAR domain-containing protein n=1 Tax=Streptomyces sp. NPDC058470 TaxID=3346515 RepID=UPI00364F6508
MLLLPGPSAERPNGAGAFRDRSPAPAACRHADQRRTLREGITLTGSPDPAVPDLTALLLTTRTLEAFLTTLAETVLDISPGCNGCGITLEREGHLLTVTSSGRSARQLDEEQYGQNDGPCLQALRTAQEISVQDTPTDRRWGEFPAYAAANGARSSLSLPIAARTRTPGAINLYAFAPDAFADADRTVLRAIAAQATGAIALAQRLADAPAFNDELQTVLATRALIDRATGITMARHDCAYDEALAFLKGTARRHGSTLRAVSATLVRQYGEPPNPSEPPVYP